MITQISSISEIRAHVARLRENGKRKIGFVPTMGALHQGHLSLVEASNKECDATLVSVFVNPMQFAPDEDFKKYPRELDKDSALLTQLRVDAIFCPTDEEMYPVGYQSTVDVTEITKLWEGAQRPTHFRGVTTVVLKLLLAVQPDFAYFGRKDFQQLRVIEQMVADLNVPTTIRPCPIVREADGLAMSSRNRYLSPEQRIQGVSLSRSLNATKELSNQGERDCQKLRTTMHKILEDAKVGIDYATIVDRRTLTELTTLDRPAVAIIAARVGSTRLIDNCELDAN
jgi:pantoate--beta-alanine ligase